MLRIQLSKHVDEMTEREKRKILRGLREVSAAHQSGSQERLEKALRKFNLKINEE